MINYTDRKNTLKLIEIEKSSLNATLSIQKNLNKQVLTFMKTFVGNIEVKLDFNPDNKIYKYINESTNALNKSNKNIENLKSLINRLEIIYTDFNNYISENIIRDKIQKYNKTFSEFIDSIYANTSFIEKFIYDISLVDLSELLLTVNNSGNLEKDDVKTKNDVTDFAIETNELESSFVENTLIISDIKGKVILPYKLEKIKEILLDENEKYSSIEDVIEKKYIIPIERYKISSISRFREAYKLIIEKEHGSHLKAFSLASELFLNYNLHPAIITACNSLDELDIYLACLDDNTLDDFKYFDIKYEIAPLISEDNKSFEKI